MPNIRTTLLLLLLAVPLVLSGCATTGKETSLDSARSLSSDVVRGSPTEDLIALLGEPQLIEPYEGDPERIQIWTYHITKTNTQFVGFNSKEVPWVDPITGELKMILEPDYQPKTTISTDTVRVYIIDDKVLGWIVDRKNRRYYND